MNKDINAIGIVRQMVADGQVSQEVAEKYFPELKENEDDRISKTISDILLIDSDEIREILDANNVLMQDIDTWLEIQGEHKKFRDGIQVGDQVTRNRDGILVNLSQLNRVAKKDEKQGENYAKHELKKQEPAEKYNDWLNFIRWFVKQRTDNYRLIPSDDDIHKWSDNILNHARKVLEQNTAEWSKEDEEIHRKCICAMRASACGFPEEEKFVEQVDNWFKSLKDRVQPKITWKPSKEQMYMLEKAILYVESCESNFNGSGLVLERLLEQLKKLREE